MSYIKHVYKLMLEDLDQNPNIKNWACFVKTTQSNSGFCHVWLAQGVGDIKIFLKILNKDFRIIFSKNGIIDLMILTEHYFIGNLQGLTLRII